MSGRRRHGGGRDERRRDARGSRPDPRAAGGGAGDTGGGYAGEGIADQRYGAPSFQPSGDTGQVHIAPQGSSSGTGQGGAPSGFPVAGYNGAAGYDATAGYGVRASADGYAGPAAAAETRVAGGYPATAGYPGDGRYGSAYGPGNYDGAGYGGYDTVGYGVGDSGAAATSFMPEFMPVDVDEPANHGPAGRRRPIGRLSIFTLLEDKAREFDRLAERAAEGVRTTEPDTLVYVVHVVPKAPMQRIIYEIYRDRAAFEGHERQPHIQRFVADRGSCVLATNIIDLRLKYAKVAALGATTAAEPQPQAQPQYQGTQSSRAPWPLWQDAPAAPAAPFVGAQPGYTPAGDGYAAPRGQYAAANGQYAAANGYSAMNGYQDANGYTALNGYSAPNGYSGASGYSGANGYSGTAGYQGANGYQGASGYQGANGYQGVSGYQAANGYQGASGYQGANGYQGASGYQGANGYQGASGYQGANGYQGASGYQGAAGYPQAAGYPEAAGYAPPATGHYPAASSRLAGESGRYREIGSGAGQPGADQPPRNEQR